MGSSRNSAGADGVSAATGREPGIIFTPALRNAEDAEDAEDAEAQTRTDRAIERRPSISHGREMRVPSTPCGAREQRWGCGFLRLRRLPRLLRSVVLRHHHASGCDSGAPGSKRSPEIVRRTQIWQQEGGLPARGSAVATSGHRPALARPQHPSTRST